MYQHSAELVGEDADAVVKVTTKESQKLSLRIRDMTCLAE